MNTETYVVTGTGTDAKNIIVKDPNAVLDYTFDWTAWLDPIADTIASKEIVAETGITNDRSFISGKTVIAWLSGGTAGTTYRVTCRIVTADGRTDDRSIFVKVKER